MLYIENTSDSIKYNITILVLQMKNWGTERSGNLPDATNLGVLAQESVLLATLGPYWPSVQLSLFLFALPPRGAPSA